MQKFKVSEFSELLNIPHTKSKRYTREFLGPDPEATIQSGHARLLNLREAFFVYLGAHLVSDLNFTVHEAKIIIEKLKPWLIEFGLFPSDENSFQKTKSKIVTWKIFIYRTDTPFYFDYGAKGVINSKIAEFIEVGTYQNVPVVTEKYVNISHVDPDPERPQVYDRDLNKIMVLRVSYLIETFKLQIEGKNPAEHRHKLFKHMILDQH
jgi:hypothetical protein